MNEKWTDFEKHVFKELNSISRRLSKLEGRVVAYGTIAGLVAAAVSEAVLKVLK